MNNAVRHCRTVRPKVHNLLINCPNAFVVEPQIYLPFSIVTVVSFSQFNVEKLIMCCLVLKYLTLVSIIIFSFLDL
jgi:hypothetical protein